MTTLLEPRTAARTTKVRLRVLTAGRVVRRVIRLKPDTPYTARELVLFAESEPKSGMSVRIGTSGFGLDDDLRSALMNAAGVVIFGETNGAATKVEGDEGVASVGASPEDEAPEVVTVMVIQNIVAG